MSPLFVNLELVANIVLAKVNIDDNILHARLDPWSVGQISSTSYD